MLGTLLAALFAAVLLFLPQIPAAAGEALGLIMAAAAGILFLLAGATHALIWNPMQKSAQNLSARLMEMFRIDPHIRYPSLWLILIFPVVSLAMSVDMIALHFVRPLPLLAIWTLLFGISIDLLYHLLRRVTGYLDPFAVIRHFGDRAEEAVREDRDAELCDWIEAIAETGFNAVDKALPSLSNEAITRLEMLARTYFKSERSIAHPQDEEPGGDETIRYTLLFTLQRLEQIYKKALDQKMEPVCKKAVTSMGKIVIDAAYYDLSLATFPLQSLDTFAKSALQKQMGDVAELVTCTLLEVSREIIEEVEIKYYDLKEAFFTVIGTLQEIAEKSFRRDKKASIPLLIQPFKELEKLFENEKLKEHQDASAIRADLARVLDQFSQLEQVMKSVPSINPEELSPKNQP